MIAAFAVGVPARDEADCIEEAIDALARAACASPAPVHLAIAADRCTDRTHDLARDALRRCRSSFAGATVVTTDAGSAGGARDAACVVALREAEAACGTTERIWVATTDADSTVPADWFGLHAAWAQWGADGVAGLVELSDDAGLDQATHTRWRAFVDRLGVGHGHPHVHGANLGMRADVWLAAGGFDHRPVGEDHELWRRARALGATLVGCSETVVRTSGRLRGRAPGGLAALLTSFDARR